MRLKDAFRLTAKNSLEVSPTEYPGPIREGSSYTTAIRMFTGELPVGGYPGTQKEKERQAYLNQIWVRYRDLLFVCRPNRESDFIPDSIDEFEFPVPKNASRAKQQLELEVFKEYLKEFDDLYDDERENLLDLWFDALSKYDLQEMIGRKESAPHEILRKAREQAKLMVRAIAAIWGEDARDLGLL
jgi:hypothetical protein